MDTAARADAAASLHRSEEDLLGAEDQTVTANRAGLIGLWALLGLFAVVVAGETWIRWITSSTQFSPAPVLGPDHYPTWRLVILRIVEAASAVVFVGLVWKALVQPLRRNRKLGVDGLIAIGCFVGSITDGVLNIYKYIFAWNAHSINLGSWSTFLPLHAKGANGRYAEALVWGIPMYMYFCLGVAIGGCAMIRRLRVRFPGMSDATSYMVLFGAACAFDFVVENLIIRTTQAYGYVTAPSSVTLWAGKAYQFPVYEMLCVAALGVIFTGLRMSSIESKDGLAYIERGLHRVNARWREPFRILAFIGFSVLVLLFVYHVPVNWLGTNGNSVAHLPSYLRP